jgi:hypothetical protein
MQQLLRDVNALKAMSYLLGSVSIVKAILSKVSLAKNQTLDCI